MNSLFNILGDRYKNSPIAKGVMAAKVVETANAVLEEQFGETISDHVLASHYKDSALTFACRSGAAAQNVKLAESTIVAKINEKVGNKAVQRVKYVF